MACMAGLSPLGPRFCQCAVVVVSGFSAVVSERKVAHVQLHPGICLRIHYLHLSGRWGSPSEDLKFDYLEQVHGGLPKRIRTWLEPNKLCPEHIAEPFGRTDG